LLCAFPALFARLHALALAVTPEDIAHMPSYVIRCPQSLPVAFRLSIARDGLINAVGV